MNTVSICLLPMLYGGMLLVLLVIGRGMDFIRINRYLPVIFLMVLVVARLLPNHWQGYTEEFIWITLSVMAIWFVARSHQDLERGGQILIDEKPFRRETGLTFTGWLIIVGGLILAILTIAEKSLSARTWLSVVATFVVGWYLCEMTKLRIGIAERGIWAGIWIPWEDTAGYEWHTKEGREFIAFNFKGSWRLFLEEISVPLTSSQKEIVGKIVSKSILPA